MKDKVWAKAIADACATKQLHLRSAHVSIPESTTADSNNPTVEAPIGISRVQH